MGNILHAYEVQETQRRLEARTQQTEVPQFRAGDDVRVHLRLVEEGGKTRTQVFQGVCLARCNRGLQSSFRVRRVGDDGLGVERVFPLYSPTIEKIDVVRYGSVRRAKLYYLRHVKGRKAARIKEDTKRRLKNAL